MTLRDFKDYVALSHRRSTKKALAGDVLPLINAILTLF